MVTSGTSKHIPLWSLFTIFMIMIFMIIIYIKLTLICMQWSTEENAYWTTLSEGHVEKNGICRSCSEGIKWKFASCILGGKVCGKRLRSRPRLTWTDDIMKWTNLKNFGVIERVAEDRDKWRTMMVNLLLEDDKWMNECNL